MAETTITVRDNGNLRISGSFEIVDAAGNVFPVEAGRPVFLCRCGHSKNKPFCDSSHSREGFMSIDRAPQPSVADVTDPADGAR
jgi:CDGSH iron-sulfur domain-containing protein 3